MGRLGGAGNEQGQGCIAVPSEQADADSVSYGLRLPHSLAIPFLGASSSRGRARCP